MSDKKLNFFLALVEQTPFKTSFLLRWLKGITACITDNFSPSQIFRGGVSNPYNTYFSVSISKITG